MIEPEIVAYLNRTFSAALGQDDPLKARANLVEAGWFDLLDADPAMAAAIVFRIQGENCLDAAALDDVIGHRLSTHWPDANGEITVVYPLKVGGGESALIHAILPAHSAGTRLLWLEDVESKGLEIVELEAELEVSPLDGVDPGTLLRLNCRPPGRLVQWAGSEAAACWDDALAWARVAVARQMVAGSRTVLTMAVDYAQAREQFGTPIGTFQSVKHRLAETQVAIAATDAAVAAAVSTGTASSAVFAKSLAGRAAGVAARNCFQVFGGIGFTAEHQFHHYLRRNLVLDRLLGDTRSLNRELGRRLRSGDFSGQRIVNLEDPLRSEIFA